MMTNKQKLIAIFLTMTKQNLRNVQSDSRLGKKLYLEQSENIKQLDTIIF